MSVDQSLNQVTIMGRCGRDPEVRTTAAGTKVANISIATDEGYMDKNANSWVDRTEWHGVVAWAGLAEKAEKRAFKGCMMLVVGKLQTTSWEDSEGNKRYRTNIVASTLKVLNRRPEGATQQSQAPAYQTTAPEDDLPF